MEKPSTIHYILGVGMRDSQEWRERRNFDEWRNRRNLNEGEPINFHNELFDTTDLAVLDELKKFDSVAMKRGIRISLSFNLRHLYEALNDPAALGVRFSGKDQHREVIDCYHEAGGIITRYATPKFMEIFNRIAPTSEVVLSYEVSNEMVRIAREKNRYVAISFYHEQMMQADFPADLAIFGDGEFIGEGHITPTGKSAYEEGCEGGELNIRIRNSNIRIPHLSPYFIGWPAAVAMNIDNVVRNLLGEEKFLIYRHT